MADFKQVVDDFLIVHFFLFELVLLLSLRLHVKFAS